MTTASFDVEKFEEQAADDQIKMIEVKLSQGAKPGHGGMLPASKISAEIAEARGIPMGQDCVSPASPLRVFNTVGDDGFPWSHCEKFGRQARGVQALYRPPARVHVHGQGDARNRYCPRFYRRGRHRRRHRVPHRWNSPTMSGCRMVEGLTLCTTRCAGAGLRDQVKLGAAGKIVIGV